MAVIVVTIFVAEGESLVSRVEYWRCAGKTEDLGVEIFPSVKRAVRVSDSP